MFGLPIITTHWTLTNYTLVGGATKYKLGANQPSKHQLQRYKFAGNFKLLSNKKPLCENHTLIKIAWLQP